MTDARPNWICCQIGAREHYAVARALHRHHALAQLLTDAWVRPMNLFGTLRPSLRARYHGDLATADVYAPNLGNIAFELRARAAGLRGWPLMIARNAWFQKVAVAHLSQGKPADGSPTLMAYSYAALEIFRFARSRGWRTVLSQIDPGPVEERIVAGLYDADPLHRADWQPPPRKYWSDWWEECSLADRIVVNSRWSYDALVDEGIPAAKIRVVPLAYDEQRSDEAFRRRYPVQFTVERPLRVLFLGQVNLRKGLGPLLDAIRLLEGKPIEFSIVGPLQLSISPEMCEHPQIRWIGPIPRQDVARYFRDADVFAFPTLSDGFGLTQLEAQAWNLPIIATRYCGEVVKDGENGWILADVTAEAIAATLLQCLDRPAILEEYSARSNLSRCNNLTKCGLKWSRIFE